MALVNLDLKLRNVSLFTMLIFGEWKKDIF